MMLKRKMMAGILAVSLTVGTGTAFAATDAGYQLQLWYGTQFKAAKANVESVLDNYEILYPLDKVKGLVTTYFINPAAKEIRGITQGTINTANDNIDDAKDIYIGQINDKKELIKTNMPGQFDSLVSVQIGETYKKVNEVYRPAINTKVTTDLDTIGDDEKLKVTNGVKTEAVAEVTSAIIGAKKDIREQIALEEGIAKTEVDTYIKGLAASEYKSLTAHTTEVERLNKLKITDEASRIEGEAITALENIVKDLENIEIPTTTP